MTSNSKRRGAACFCLAAIIALGGCSDGGRRGPIEEPKLPGGLALPGGDGGADVAPTSTGGPAAPAMPKHTELPLTMGAPFTDNAILQRQMPVPVWGWATTGDTVTVRFAGQTKTATARGDGKWTVTLGPLESSASPAEMTVADGKGAKVTLKNILVGEVWLASGQSNMQWIASKCNVGSVLQKQIAERVAAGKEKPPVIREGKVTNIFSALHPIEHA
ncbi:MAG: hypothetical protein ACYS9X_24270, partial [Planctomycetota bacterium]